MADLDLTVIILTYNEEIHIRRVIDNILQLTPHIVIVDSYSSDRTEEISKQAGATVYQNEFTNQASQFLWALENCKVSTSWVMRLDADEYLTSDLIMELNLKLPSLSNEISGIIFKRRLHFMGTWIRHGGYYPVHLLRAWRNGHASIEKRLMDEHIYLTQGKSVTFDHDFIDDNLNSLSSWISKHNEYATREAVEILRSKQESLNRSHKNKDSTHKTNNFRRWYKNNIYLKFPKFIRCFLYFNLRYWILLGFLDGKAGLVWHVLQGFWYRFLVDAKMMQIEEWAMNNKQDIKSIIKEKYGISL
jgi:glycosyltransferase involved in cell wall biosynthesis